MATKTLKPLILIIIAHPEDVFSTNLLVGILVARAIRNAIRANRFPRIIRNWNPYFYSASGRLARITRISDSRESPDSRESCESIRANHATKVGIFSSLILDPSRRADTKKSSLISEDTGSPH